MWPVKEIDLELYVDVYFSSNWGPKEIKDSDTAISRHGYVIVYAVFPMF